MTSSTSQFTFAISLSVLDHLGRNLYRSFATVIGEAISNAWDANADHVWIYTDSEKNSFFIKDDGDGMTAEDFQNKFLKIGYSKRREGMTTSPIKERPYIGRKGIGKLALLSCAENITVISKVDGGEYIGGSIKNSGLDDAIKEDLTPQQYPLEKVDLTSFNNYLQGHQKGTIIHFEGVKEGMKKNLAILRQIIASNFKFSLIDNSFEIFLDERKITTDDLKEVAKKTQFLWNINGLKNDFYLDNLKELKNIKGSNIILENKDLEMEGEVKGFIASVKFPKDLKIDDTDEKISVDLFVNGRLREKDILKRIPTARIVESYLYGQIHLDGLDDEKDRFTSSREGIVADDEKFREFLDSLKKVLSTVLQDWDNWRRKHKNDGDPENKSIPPKERKAESLFNVIAEEYSIQEEDSEPDLKKKVNQWIDDLGSDAKYNFASYADCFISENLIRKQIEKEKISLSTEAQEEITTRKDRETLNKNKGNVSIDIRKVPTNCSYLSMDHLANLVDKRDPIREACLSRDANEYKPIRDALMHTALLTNEAKQRLTTVSDNIKGRVRCILSTKDNSA